MIKVDNAVIMAAGMSSRFAPISYECPKALLKVKGEILIERQIMQLKEAGIRKIVVVVGYLKEKFQYLKEKYQVILIENPVYDIRNNHSTLYVARKYLKNTYICNGDNYFSVNVFHEEEKCAYYSAVFEQGNTMEWCMKTDEKERLVGVEVGGRNSWVMAGHAFITEAISQRLIPQFEEVYKKEKTAEQFWEEILIENLQYIDIYIKEYKQGEILEFDSLEDLKKFDSTYVNNSGSSIMKNICKALRCKEQDIGNIQPIKSKQAVVGIHFLFRDGDYTYYYAEQKLKEARGKVIECR